MNRKQLVTGVAVAAGLAVVALFFVFNQFFTMQPSDSQATSTDDTSGLIVQDEQVGTGAVAEAGDTVAVSYVGKLQDGTIFDQTSVHTGISPGCTQAGQYCFVLGAGSVIPGWDMGLQGMKVGGKRLLIIPSNLGYGAQQVGPIPPNSTLIFEVTLLGVTPASSTSTPVSPVGAEGSSAN